MSMPYGFEPCHELESMDGTVGHTSANEYNASGITREDHGLGIRAEDIIQNCSSPQLANADMPWFFEPYIDTTFQRILDLEMKTLFGTPNDTTGSVRANDVTNMAEPKNGTQTSGSAHSCSRTASCQWLVGGSSEACSAQITCKSVPSHFRDAHHVRKLTADTLIRCWWEGCPKQLKRKYFVRHVRECHLGHIRATKHISLKRVIELENAGSA
ncbi:hypothetical protein HD554DRAFT_2038779 [Boletus coccyginus]|nr:hypothetical protein HD554DRAFT_2038779 [Boletus coccyginus]